MTITDKEIDAIKAIAFANGIFRAPVREAETVVLKCAYVDEMNDYGVAGRDIISKDFARVGEQVKEHFKGRIVMSFDAHESNFDSPNTATASAKFEEKPMTDFFRMTHSVAGSYLVAIISARSAEAAESAASAYSASSDAEIMAACRRDDDGTEDSDWVGRYEIERLGRDEDGGLVDRLGWPVKFSPDAPTDFAHDSARVWLIESGAEG